MICCDFTYTPPPCPVCKQGRAYMSSTAWSPFKGSACGEVCGQRAKAAIEEVQASDLWRKAQERAARARQRMIDLEWKAIDAIQKAKA